MAAGADKSVRVHALMKTKSTGSNLRHSSDGDCYLALRQGVNACLLPCQLRGLNLQIHSAKTGPRLNYFEVSLYPLASISTDAFTMRPFAQSGERGCHRKLVALPIRSNEIVPSMIFGSLSNPTWKATSGLL